MAQSTQLKGSSYQDTVAWDSAWGEDAIVDSDLDEGEGVGTDWAADTCEFILEWVGAWNAWTVGAGELGQEG
jgi:hypothetical protein